MHEPLNEKLEEFLEGDRVLPEVEAHLASCASCRLEVAILKQHSEMLRSLRVEEEPRPGFYARVMNRVESQTKISVWSIFSDSPFAKRLSYASLSFLVLLGTYLVSTTESNQPLTSAMPESILAGEEQPQPVGMDPQRDRAVVLVNLATYQE